MTYKLRAEFFLDVFTFIESFKPLTYKIIKDGVLPDVEFEFDSDCNIDSIINAIEQLEDCHVMAQTIKPINEYTGERIIN
jgi:hypothetical protein